MQTKQEIANLFYRLARKFEAILLISHILNLKLMPFKLMLLSCKYNTVLLGSIWKVSLADNVFHLPGLFAAQPRKSLKGLPTEE